MQADMKEKLLKSAQELVGMVADEKAMDFNGRKMSEKEPKTPTKKDCNLDQEDLQNNVAKEEVNENAQVFGSLQQQEESLDGKIQDEE